MQQLCLQTIPQLMQAYATTVFSVGPLDFAVVDILSTLLETVNGNVYVVVVTDSYSKLTKAIPSSEGAPTNIVGHLSRSLDHTVRHP